VTALAKELKVRGNSSEAFAETVISGINVPLRKSWSLDN